MAGHTFWYVSILSHLTWCCGTDRIWISCVEVIWDWSPPVSIERNSFKERMWKAVSCNTFKHIAIVSTLSGSGCTNLFSISCVEVITYCCSPVAIQRYWSVNLACKKVTGNAFRRVAMVSNLPWNNRSNFWWISCVEVISYATLPVAIKGTQHPWICTTACNGQKKGSTDWSINFSFYRFKFLVV